MLCCQAGEGGVRPAGHDGAAAVQDRDGGGHAPDAAGRARVA